MSDQPDNYHIHFERGLIYIDYNVFQQCQLMEKIPWYRNRYKILGHIISRIRTNLHAYISPYQLASVCLFIWYRDLIFQYLDLRTHMARNYSYSRNVLSFQLSTDKSFYRMENADECLTEFFINSAVPVKSIRHAFEKTRKRHKWQICGGLWKSDTHRSQNAKIRFELLWIIFLKCLN